MPIYTPLLNLLKKVAGVDPATDKFNVQTMMNDNWDKIDAAMALQAVNGAARAATTANITLSGLQTVDGVVLAAGDRVLVKDQTMGSQNGIYVVASGAWARAADTDSTDKLAAGASVYVRSGTVNIGKTFVMSNATFITLGTTAITFSEITAVGQVRTKNNMLDDGATGGAQFKFVGLGRAPNGGYSLDAESGIRVNGVIQSTVADGVVPFNLVSKTMVPNLNAQYFGGYTVADFNTMLSNVNAVKLQGYAASEFAKRPASVSEFNVTSSTGQSVLSNPSPTSGNYLAFIYLRVTAATTISVTVAYADATGVQTTSVVNVQAFAVGSYSLLPVFLNTTTPTAISIQASSSVSGAAKISASILGV